MLYELIVGDCMVQIEGHWETIDTLQDVSRIIREYYNNELADEVDRLVENYEVQEKYEEQVRELEDVIDQIRSLVM